MHLNTAGKLLRVAENGSPPHWHMKCRMKHDPELSSASNELFFPAWNPIKVPTSFHVPFYRRRWNKFHKTDSSVDLGTMSSTIWQLVEFEVKQTTTNLVASSCWRCCNGFMTDVVVAGSTTGIDELCARSSVCCCWWSPWATGGLVRTLVAMT